MEQIQHFQIKQSKGSRAGRTTAMEYWSRYTYQGFTAKNVDGNFIGKTARNGFLFFDGRIARNG